MKSKSIIPFYSQILIIINYPALFTNKLPFSGKVAIRPTTVRFFKERRANKKWKSFIKVVVLLIFMIVCHAIQAMMGYGIAFYEDLLWARVVGALYCIVNSLVSYAQFILLIRVIKHTFRFYRIKREKETTPPGSFSDYCYSPKYVFLCLVVTLLGQGAIILATCFV